MRLPKTAHTSRPWRIHGLTADFRLEDVWALPTPGGPDDFPRLVALMASGDPSHGSSRAARTLWAIRWKVGKLLGWDGPAAVRGSQRPTLRDRLPVDLRDASSSPDFGALPFTPLYLIDDEFAAEISNQTMHGVMHLGWVPDGTGGYRGQMAVLVRPNGLRGAGYMAAIKPFRHLIVYPPMMRQIGRKWRPLAGDPAQSFGGKRSSGNEGMGMAERIALPATVAELAALDTVDYQEAFAIDTDTVLTPEEWARLILEGAPAATRAALLGAWKPLGVRLAPLGSDGQVLGWPIQYSGSQAIVLGVECAIGFTARMVIQVQPGRIIHAMLCRFERDAGRDAFTALAPRHTQVVRSLLEDANRRADAALTRPTSESES